ncbi:alpha/beta fold hydrolase [Bradyrhizobium jicamae]|uniref:alpha/beta fold hydrolase n=1 Tax=Bradyrhizobium jicamae TaxID=280332 RepID=UPI001BAB5CA0|nr:alpha/beta hydrolase [Bradyrhizobium jicamae]MBR0933724.1 alpha/beta hydrolase [Bradyrhizobium jicamae]
MSGSNAELTVVMVHGAWADGSSWTQVIRLVQAHDIRCLAAPIPLTSLSDDVRALDRTLERTNGPVMLAAHAYAGAVIGSTRSDRVRGLVFVSALAPDEGETVADVFYREPPHPQAPQLAPDSQGYIWMPESGFPSAFAQHASKADNALFAAVQRPINVACIQEKAPRPLWKSVPAWYLLAEQDRMISPKTQEFMATRMKAEIRRMDVDHTPIATAPEKVTDVLLAAAARLSGQDQRGPISS